MAYKHDVDISDLQLMKSHMTPPCSANRDATLTAANLANVEAIRNGGVPVVVALPSTMELPAGVSLTEYMQQLMQSVGE